MKIVNETCYNTEDLEELANKCQETMLKCKELAEEHGVHFNIRDDIPEQVRVGYYQPSGAHRYSGHKYINPGGWRCGDRLGIVKRSKLNVNALTALAEAADGAELSMPQEAVREIAEYFAGLHGSTWCLFPWKEQNYGSYYGSCQETFHTYWAFVDSFKIRYALRAKRGSKALAAVARDQSKLEKRKKEVRWRQRDVKDAERKLEVARGRLADTLSEIERLSKKLGVE